jgi:lysophospholipase L1-like esterase
MRVPRPLAAALAAAALSLVAAPAAGAAAPRSYAVAVGESYAVGFQPGLGATRQGFNVQLVTKARARGYRLTLANFGCGGATTTSVLRQEGCSRRGRARGARAYSGTQVAAATAFLRAHRGHVAIATVSIGGNDVTRCGMVPDPVTCVGTVVRSIERNLGELVRRLRKAGGAKLRIVGITYPDVILGRWVRPPVDQDLARLSVVAFGQIINPALKRTYGARGARFVDVTAATGAYTPLEQLTTLAPYGEIPVAVAKVCELTWYCEKGDIHARTAGYGVIADLIARTLPRRG